MTKRMYTATKRALDKSIAKWEQIAKGEDVSKGTRNCALCQRFSVDGTVECERHTAFGIEQCPVRLKTGVWACANTPYIAFSHNARKIYAVDGFELHPVSDRAKASAVRERDFLISLLPRAPKK